MIQSIDSFPSVLCLGEALVDRLGPLGGDPAIDQPVEDCLGGAPANVACGLARLGVKAAFLGCLGDDWIGESFQELMRSRDINMDALQIDASRPSRIVLVSRTVTGERVFKGFAGSKGDGFADQAIEVTHLKKHLPLLATKAKWLLLGSIPLASRISAESLLWTIEYVKRFNLSIALDVNWRPTFWDPTLSPDVGPTSNAIQAIERLFGHAALIKLAREEAQWFFNTDEPARIARSLTTQPDVVVTDGANPVKWCIGGLTGQTEALSPAVVVDTTGAGDAFTAGLLHQFLTLHLSSIDEQKVHEMVRFAAACGALVCGGAGAIDPQPTKDQAELFLSSPFA